MHWCVMCIFEKIMTEYVSSYLQFRVIGCSHSEVLASWVFSEYLTLFDYFEVSNEWYPSFWCYILKCHQCYVRALVFWMMGVFFFHIIWLFYLIETFFQFITSVKKHSTLDCLFHFCWIMLMHSFVWSRLSHFILIDSLGSVQMRGGRGRRLAQNDLS